ncbi:hypothetical protein Prede_2592 [Prevotella dentalis DSM 3688]|uniref:Uncharacterized protein n=1 Tax=Prevotella dentalis (strain ATCC 49559 / DSM 3688 / JCM 13448 / NCTC 12043 / ES 2772) TaxID=908937 RepID=F9D795_PREDD|nr:hypothetical protein [Prevotella dentalis]AGB29743.1 hypothetical protein Prede_2497 [Prevotella dentalis DSM 3688]AGB29826.1 hypothetical protein Prede_2592 [Prevotella dentalis DSM 3688]EGQ11461.1 hypothetical protein HMPREF9136_2723 [Prevotella dentalis DSM 3688]
MVTRLIKALVFDWRLRRAIRKARHDADLHRRKFLVLIYGGKPVVVSKQGIRRLIARHRFPKGFTAATAERIAAFVATPKTRP